MEEMTGRPHDDNEPEPSWDEAVAVLASGDPVDLVRPYRTIVVNYRYEDRHVHATSPDLMGFEVIGSTLYEAMELVRIDLARYLGSGVELVEHEPSRPIHTEATSRSRVISGPRELVTTAAAGCSRTLIAPSRVRVS